MTDTPDIAPTAAPKTDLQTQAAPPTSPVRLRRQLVLGLLVVAATGAVASTWFSFWSLKATEDAAAEAADLRGSIEGVDGRLSEMQDTVLTIARVQAFDSGDPMADFRDEQEARQMRQDITAIRRDLAMVQGDVSAIRRGVGYY